MLQEAAPESPPERMRLLFAPVFDEALHTRAQLFSAAEVAVPKYAPLKNGEPMRVPENLTDPVPEILAG